MKTGTGRRSHAHAVQLHRTHDHLYNPDFILSSQRDYARAEFRAHTATDRLKCMPKYNTMFSELRHHPPYNVQLSQVDPVPPFVPRQWLGTESSPSDCNPEAVRGKERYKYFGRPQIPFIEESTPGLVLQRQTPIFLERLVQQKEQVAAFHESSEVELTEPANKTTAVQTVYRDGEAQTVPYTPEYVVQQGCNPEVLTLMKFTWGDGLPPGQAEIQTIERARQKRAWEETLPPLRAGDPRQILKRKAMMEAMERQEWAYREEEIDKFQEDELTRLESVLKKRIKKKDERTEMRLEKRLAKIQEKKERTLREVQAKHLRAVRRLVEKRRNVEGKFVRRDIVRDYMDPGSSVYAPPILGGVFPDSGSEKYKVQSKYLDSYEGLCELEETSAKSALLPKIKAPKSREVELVGSRKKELRKENLLKQVYEAIKKEQQEPTPPKPPPRFLEKIEKPVPRPPTPTVQGPVCDENKELAIITLQKIIRGCAVQTAMYKTMQKREDLMEELRSTHALQSSEQEIIKRERQSMLALQRHRKLLEQKEYRVDEILSKLEGASLSHMVDYLGKELVRCQEERRIYGLASEAERERRIREAEESGKRQVEIRRRRELDEMYRQVIQVHQNTVETYLEDIILDAVDHTADKQAREEAYELAQKINNAAYEAHGTLTDLETEELIAELVHSFLLLEIHKKVERDKVKSFKRKHLIGARQAIFDLTNSEQSLLPSEKDTEDGGNSVAGSTDREKAIASILDLEQEFEEEDNKEYELIHEKEIQDSAAADMMDKESFHLQLNQELDDVEMPSQEPGDDAE